MTAWNRSLFLVLLASSLMAFGCGDDDPVADSGTPTDTGTGTDTGMDADICPATGDYWTGAGDACLNADDIAAVSRTDYGTGMDMDANDIAGACAVECLADPDFVTCSSACIERDSDVSNTCAACFSGSTACAAQFCAGPCLADPASAACGDCRAGMGTNSCSFDCVQEYYDCSGFPRNPTDAGTDAGGDAGGDAGADAAADAAADA